MTHGVIHLVLQLGKKKVPEGLVFKIKQGLFVEKVASDESTITGAGFETTGVNDPPQSKYQNNSDIHLE